jgi:hypothetical protein
MMVLLLVKNKKQPETIPLSSDDIANTGEKRLFPPKLLNDVATTQNRVCNF